MPKVGPQTKPFRYGLPITTIDIGMACSLAESNPSLIVYAFWKRQGNYARQLMQCGVPLVIHDPAEFHDAEMDFIKTIGHTPIVIRKRNVIGLREYGIDATYAPHPYVREAAVEHTNKCHAVSLARIDFRKRSHWLVEANKLLPPDMAIQMHGEISRIYEYHQLRKWHPDWRQWYHGEFDDRFGEAVRLTAEAKIAVDLTHIDGDGGGTQYTFFEAWDAGVPLILNAAWATGPDDEVRDGDSCVMVKDSAELANAVRRPIDEYASIMAGANRVLTNHSPIVVGHIYLKAMGAI